MLCKMDKRRKNINQVDRKKVELFHLLSHDDFLFFKYILQVSFKWPHTCINREDKGYLFILLNDIHSHNSNREKIDYVLQ